jgi:phage terminase large subunit-like protein
MTGDDPRPLIDRLNALGDDMRTICELFDAVELRAIRDDWRLRARPAQLPPEGDWRIWLIQAGRGFGKTRAGAEWIDDIARRQGNLRLALVGATLHDVRSVMVEGESGVLNLPHAGTRPVWLPSLGQLRWHNGTRATAYSAAEPEGLRGPQFHYAWADEVGRWGLAGGAPRALAAWDNLRLSVRRGAMPQLVVTTTPRATPLMRQILAMPGLVLTRGASEENAANMPDSWLAAMRADFAGTRLERQELDGELIEDVAGALWTRALIDQCRMTTAGIDEGALQRVVIGVDPPAGTASGEGGDACGIVVAGLTGDGRLLVLEDASVADGRPDMWAAAVAAAARRWRADRVVAEANNGGAMVASVLRNAAVTLPVRLVHASRGKVARAEPVQALYAQGRVRHAGRLAALEDELCGMLIGGGYAGPGRSPDRADAAVWALTELARGLGQTGPALKTI